ncbi:MAG TPA: hypothetical protein VGK19_03120 [Capsulimonadaceae bacterium]|jgi:membrane-associated phospholipid phosphatase
MHDALLFVSNLLADVINPALVLLWLWLVVGLFRSRDNSRWRWVLASLLGVAICVAGVHLLRAEPVWPGHPYFPSGHEAFAASVATSIAWRFGVRWGALAALCASILAPSLVLAGFHEVWDVVASLVVCPVVTIACHVILRISLPILPRSDR